LLRNFLRAIFVKTAQPAKKAARMPVFSQALLEYLSHRLALIETLNYQKNNR
jgi:hypothetical protein